MTLDPWAIFDHIALTDPASLVGWERHVQAYAWLRTEVNNGGFHQYLFNSSGDSLLTALEAVRSVGPHELEVILRSVVETLGPECVLTDRASRQAALQAGGGRLEQELAELDGAYFDVESSQDLDAAMRGLVA